MKKIIYINFFVTIFLLLCTEFFFRYVLDYNLQGMSKNIIVESDNFKFNNKNLKKAKAFGVNIYTDSNGFRIPERFKRKISNQILFIGGSVTFGGAVKSEDTFVEKLNQENSLSIINASVIGSTFENNYKIYSKFYKKDKTEKVFISLAVDDIKNANIVEEINSISIKNKIKSVKIFNYINSFLITKSTAYVFFKTYLINSKKIFFLKELKNFENTELLNGFNSILDKFASNKEKITFYILPYSEQVTNDGCLNRDITQQVFEKELNKRNLKFINFKKYFCKQKNVEKFYLKNDHAHLSKKGHQFIFKILKNYMN